MIDSPPLFTGHSGPVLDTDFNPFNERIVASASEDANVRIWSVPKEAQTADITTPLLTLKNHSKKVGQVTFHPTASNVLASSSGDLTIKVFL
jgi:coronin-1B/1C/6